MYFFVGLICLLAFNSYAGVTHFSQPESQPLWCKYAGKVTLNGVSAVDGDDEVGVFVSDGQGGEICIGSGVMGDTLSGYYYFNIYGDDASTSEIKEGASSNEELIFKVWDKSADEEFVISDISNQTFTGLTLPALPPVFQDGKTFGELNLSKRDVISLQWYAATQSISESAGTILLTAVLTSAYTENVDVTYTVSGSAVYGEDHNLADGSLTVNTGKTAQSISIDITDDTTTENTETIIVTMGTPTNVEPGAITVHTISIIDNDLPTVNWSSASQDVDESVGTVTVTATLDKENPVADVIVHYSVSGTSTSADHNAESATLTITSGNTSASIPISIINDQLTENNETLIITMDNVENADTGETTVHNIIINDNDVPTVNWSLETQLVDEGVGSVTITATLDEVNPREDVTISYTIGGTSTYPDDHNAADGTLTIISGNTTATRTFTIYDDTSVEENETLIVTMSNVTNATKGSTDIQTITINDNDVPTVSWSQETQTIGEDAGTVTITATLNVPNPKDNVSISYTVGGTSESPYDHNADDATITITSGNTTAVTTFTINDDALVEKNETLIVTMSNVTNATKGTPDTQTITINDNDVPTANWSLETQNVDENVRTVTVTATLDELNPREDVTISYTISGTSEYPDDHNAVDGTITITSGNTSAFTVFTINDDTSVEENETLIITMSNVTNATKGSTDTQTITINDNDVPKLKIVGQTYSDEANETVVLTATMDQPNPRGDIVISYQVTGSATENTDYSIAPTSPVTIESGQTSTVITIIVDDDDNVEPNETVIVTLTNASDAELINPSSHTLTILDNDSPRIEWSEASQAVWEDVGTVTITAVLDKPSYQEISASYVVTGGDSDLSSGNVTIPSEQTSTPINFTIFRENICEADESITITLTNPQNANLGEKYVHIVNVKEICPDFTPDNDITVLEDASLTTESWATEITTGAPHVNDVAFIVTNNNNALFTQQPAIAENGDLTFEAKPDLSGSATVQVQMKSDNFYLSKQVSFTITVTAVNDCPVFSLHSSEIMIDEDADIQIINDLATDIGPGAPDEMNQSLEFNLSATNSEIFAQGPELTLNGRLIYKILENENGVSVVTVQLSDDGGTQNNGCDSTEKSFTITVNPLNDPPINTQLPKISGILQVDQTLSSDKGLWNDSNDQTPGNLTYSYQWEMSDSVTGINQKVIPDATNDTLTLTSALVRKFVRLSVTASDDGEGTGGQSLTRFSRYLGPVNSLPSISFETSGQRVTEESGRVGILVSLSRSSAVDVTLPYTIKGTASGSDYELASSQPFVITAGITKAMIMIDIVNDAIDESEETIIVELGTPSEATSGLITQHTITIKENDSTPVIASLSPAESYAKGGISVIISGDNFVPGAEVSFGDVVAKSMVTSKNSISCVAPEYTNDISQDTTVTVTVTNPGGNNATDSFTYLAMKYISGQVTANDAPIEGCLIQVGLGFKNIHTLTDENGFYTVNNLPSNDKYIVSAWPDNTLGCYNSQYYDGKEDASTADYVSTVSGSQKNIDFSLTPCANGSISGIVKDCNGDAITTGKLLVMAFSSTLGESKIDFADQDGSYTIKGLKNGDYEVSVLWSEKSDTEFYYDNVIVREQATHVTIENNQLKNIDLIICADQTGSIEGNVYDCSGKPLAYVYVVAKSEGLNIQKPAFTDRNGHYSISDLPVVEEADRLTNGYVISAKKQGYPVRHYDNTYDINSASLVTTGSTDINISGIGCGHSISGRVTDESGQPVSMVPVLAKSISGESKETSGIAYSDINGYYTITSLMPSNDYVVHAVPMDYKNQYYNNATTLADATLVDISTENKSGIDFVLTEGPVLCGTITPPKEGIPVNIWSESTQTGGTVLTDSNGVYKITGLDPDADDYILSVIIKDYLPAFYHSERTVYRWSEAEPVAPSSVCDKDITLTTGFSIYGYVTYDGEPVYNVKVEAYSDNGGWGQDDSQRYFGKDYNYIIKGLKPGSYEVTADVRQGCYSSIPQNITIDDEDVELEIVLSNTCSSIFGTINGLPNGKTVKISAFSISNGSGDSVLVTGPDNDYTITNLKPASDYIVWMTSNDYPSQYYQDKTSMLDADYVDLSSGDQTGIDFTIVTPTTISGKLTFTNAQTGDIATVIAFSSSTQNRDAVDITYPETQYTLTVKPASDYIIFVKSLKFESTPSERLVDATSNVTDVDFTLSSGAEISGRIKDKNGNTVSGVIVEAWSDSTGTWAPSLPTDSSGNYVIEGLTSADDYIVYVDDPVKGYFFYSTDGTVKDKSLASDVSVVSSNASNINISFFELDSITGYVKDENGKAISNIWVYAWSDTVRSGNGSKTDLDGYFEITGLDPAVDYVVEVIPFSNSPYKGSEKSDIDSGSTTDLLFILLQGYTLSGTVTNNDGDPVSKAVVEIRSISKGVYKRIKTDSQGSYEIKGIAPSFDYKLMVTATGDNSYIPVKEDIAIVNDTTKNIVLSPGFSIYGYVKEDGTGVKNVMVTIISLSNSFFAKEITNYHGYYEFNNVPAGSDFEVTARPVNYAQQTQVDQTAGTEVNFNLSTGGPVSGYVRDASLNPLAGVRVKITSSHLNAPKGTTTDSNGYYAFEGLPEYDLSGNIIADYEITVTSSDYPQQVESNIKVDDTVNFTLVSTDNNILSGTIADSNGNLPPSENYVYVYLFKKQASAGLVDKMRTDANGEFEFTGLQSDQEYQIKFKILQGSHKLTKGWLGSNGPVSGRVDATGILPGNDANIQMDFTW